MKIDDILKKIYAPNYSNTLVAQKDNLKYGLLYLPFLRVIILDNNDFERFLKLVDIKFKK